MTRTLRSSALAVAAITITALAAVSPAAFGAGGFHKNGAYYSGTPCHINARGGQFAIKLDLLECRRIAGKAVRNGCKVRGRYSKEADPHRRHIFNCAPGEAWQALGIPDPFRL